MFSKYVKQIISQEIKIKKVKKDSLKMRDGRYACRSKILPDLNVKCVAKASYSLYFLAFLSLFIHLRNISDYVFTNKNIN